MPVINEILEIFPVKFNFKFTMLMVKNLFIILLLVQFNALLASHSHRVLHNLLKKMEIKKPRNISSSGIILEEDEAEEVLVGPQLYGEIGSECNIEMYQRLSWVHYFGVDPFCEDEIINQKLQHVTELLASNPKLAEQLCYNPLKILECAPNPLNKIARCICARSRRWRLEQKLEEEEGDCRFGSDADCDPSVSWSVCKNGLNCTHAGFDSEGQSVHRCRVPTTDELEDELKIEKAKSHPMGEDKSSSGEINFNSPLFLLLMLQFTFRAINGNN